MAMRWRPHVEIQGVTLLLTWWEETAYGGVWIGGWAPREGGGQMGRVTWESKGEEEVGVRVAGPEGAHPALPWLCVGPCGIFGRTLGTA